MAGSGLVVDQHAPPGARLRAAVTEGRRAFFHLRHSGLEGVRRWHRQRRIADRTPSVGRVGTSRDAAPVFDPWPLPTRPTRRDLRVAVILDPFSALAFGPEWTAIPLTPDDWRERLAAEPVDLLFVESAWHGNDDAWQYHLTGPSAPRPALVALVEACRVAGVPTVFWNKEDPAHYADFLDTARLFEHVFTTDSTRLPDYRRDLGHDRVDVLSFAAQPAIHNPVRPARGHQSRDIAFGGMYFAHKFPERRTQMDLLLGAAHAVSPRLDTGLEIFSRYLGGDERYQFPAPFADRVVGSLDYPRMLSAYKAYKVFLNVNSVVDSPSMCARRIFEITASGTPVVSTPSPAIAGFFEQDVVHQVSDAQQAAWTLRALTSSPELRDRAVHLGQREIWRHHTYGHRVDRVLDAVGLQEHRRRTPSVSVVASSNRPAQLEHLLRTVAAQEGVSAQLVLVTHGHHPTDADRARLRARAAEAGVEDLVILHRGADVPLGTCLNDAVDAADGEVVAKMDDDDLYGPHYLADQLFALEYSGAGIVGKQAHYVHVRDLDVVVLRFPEREHRWTDFVMGPTITGSRDVVREHRFGPTSRGEDTALLAACVRAGVSVYSSDRFGFIQVRHDRHSGHRHTWGASHAEILANGVVHGYGDATAHVMV